MHRKWPAAIVSRIQRALKKRTHAAKSARITTARKPFLESLESRQLLATLTVTNTNDNGGGSLRKAITDANNRSGADTIVFNISGSGVKTITPASPLPAITEAVTIDGYTQPGSSPNTLATGDNAVLRIEINGASAGAGASGLTISGGGSTVRGLVINRFGGDAVRLQSSNNRVVGDFLGTNSAGAAALKNSGQGVNILPGATLNVIGTNGDGLTDLAERNLISGNGGNGILISGAGANQNIVAGNNIGTNAAGTAALPNSGSGVAISLAASNNTIGGALLVQGNLIADNTQAGIQVTGNGATGNSIVGNSIHDNGAASLVVNTTASADTVDVTATVINVNGSTISYANVNDLSVNTLGGNDSVTAESLSASTTIDGGAPAGGGPGDGFAGAFAGDFSGSLTLHDFENVTLGVGGNLSGAFLVPENPAVLGSGTINLLHVAHDVSVTGVVQAAHIVNAIIGGSMHGTLIATGDAEIGYLEIDGDLGESGQIIAADLDANNQPVADTGSIATLIIGSDDTLDTESADGSIVTGDLGDMNVNGDVGDDGQIIVGSLDSGTIDGDMNGLIEATGQGEINSLSIGGSLDGDVVAGDDVTLNPDGSYSVATDTGSIDSVTVGNGDDSIDGSITTGDLSNLDVNGDVGDSGTIIVGSLDSGTIDGDMNGLIEATGQGEIGALIVGGDLGGDVVAGDDVTLNPDGSYSVATDTGSIDSLTVGNGDDSIDGSITTGDLSNLDVNGDVGADGAIVVGSLDSGTIDGDMNGLIEATGAGTIGNLAIRGAVGLNGKVVAAPDEHAGSGHIEHFSAGSLEGLFSADTANDLTIGNFGGNVQVQNLLQTLTITQQVETTAQLAAGEVVNGALKGTDGDDVFTFSAGSIRINGALLSARFDALSINGGGGNDTFVFTNGTSVPGTIDGGPGTNTLDYSAYTTPVSVMLGDVNGSTALPGTAPGTSGVTNIQNAIGGSANDTLIGNNQDNVLTGNGGVNTLDGKGGVNRVFETDTSPAGNTSFTLTSTKLTGVGIDNLANTQKATMIGGAGANVMDASGFNGSVFMDGKAGDDQLTSGNGNSVLIGGDGNDTLTGGAGNDVLVGGSGSDRLIGSSGNDVIIAGDLTGAHDVGNPGDIGSSTVYNFDELRAIGDAWAVLQIQDADLTVGGDDVVDTAIDQLTGGSGADWFIIDSADKITDLSTKSGDVVEIV